MTNQHGLADTTAPTSEREGLYATHPNDAADKRLQELLLGHGGVKAGIMVLDDDTPRLVEEGYLMDADGIIVFSDGIPSKCHQNCGDIWRSGEWQGYVCTGYALTDGAWLVHSWMIDDYDCIYETTGIEREKYFGVVLEPEEADRFAWENY